MLLNYVTSVCAEREWSCHNYFAEKINIKDNLTLQQNPNLNHYFSLSPKIVEITNKNISQSKDNSVIFSFKSEISWSEKDGVKIRHQIMFMNSC